MKWSYRLNLIAVGVSCMGALLSALGGNLWLMLINVAMAFLNWNLALKSEETKEENQ